MLPFSTTIASFVLVVVASTDSHCSAHFHPGGPPRALHRRLQYDLPRGFPRFPIEQWWIHPQGGFERGNTGMIDPVRAPKQEVMPWNGMSSFPYAGNNEGMFTGLTSGTEAAETPTSPWNVEQATDTINPITAGVDEVPLPTTVIPTLQVTDATTSSMGSFSAGSNSMTISTTGSQAMRVGHAHANDQLNSDKKNDIGKKNHDDDTDGSSNNILDPESNAVPQRSMAGPTSFLLASSVFLTTSIAIAIAA